MNRNISLTLSATIITLQEEKNLRKCLNSLKNLVDDIIVVDSGSKDKTVSVAKEFDAKVFFRKFDNFANQKNFALSKTSGKWVLSVDADELIPNSLADEIKHAVKTNNFVGYLIPRRNFILGAEIKHSRWSPDQHIWLWRKGMGKWVGEVHEEVVVCGKVGKLINPKLHYSHHTVRKFISVNKLYSDLEAHQLRKLGIEFSLIKMIKEALFEFNVRFFYKKGFLDGWRGLVLAALMSWYKILVWWKLKGLEND